MKVGFFICILSLGALLAGSESLYAQEKTSVQVKIFDEQLKPLAGLEISINGEPFIRINERGTAFMDIEESNLPPQTVKIRNETLEAASWNYSKGVLEIIVRKKNYKMAQLGVYDAKGRAIPGVTITFEGKQKISAETNASGLAAVPLALDDRIRTKSQFSVPGYVIINLVASEKENKLIVKPVKAAPVADAGEKAGEVILDEKYFKNFDLKNLDSIQSLTLFYAVFKNYEIDDLPDSIRKKVDRKFNELIGRLEDSLKQAPRSFIGKISDSSVVNDDIKNLLAQAVAEGRTLDEMHTSYNEKVLVIQGKLQAGIENLDPVARESLMKDIELLEQILALNEDKFYKNQT
ncbi:MAG TPA: hypothetical protein VD816_02460, partial [Ohtaekwangia sp.]|nr:hypothetical protein [Ohtaekwangia sp.]